MKIKICGITRPEDAVLAVRLGATHIGCVMVPDSPRFVTPTEAKEIFAAAGRVVKVLVFRAELPEVILETAHVAGTRHVQLYEYEESEAEALQEKNLVVYRVFEIPTGSNMLPQMLPPPGPKTPAFLDVTGSTTEITFPWEILGSEAPPRTFISGGITPENLCALLTHNPYGMDIGGGVEQRPGIKDPERMELFFDVLARALP